LRSGGHANAPSEGAALCLVSGAPAYAQFETATVLGAVKDNTGAVVPGATVTLASVEPGITQTKVTDGAGGYEFFNARVGTYRVTASLQGFSSAVAAGIHAGVGARVRVDLTLAPGQVAEQVEVTGQGSPLERDSSQRGQGKCGACLHDGAASSA
jgi:hypothetical protein